MSLPVFALVPLTAIFLGKTIVTAYLASRPELAVAQMEVPPHSQKPADVKADAGAKASAGEAPLDKKAQSFRDLAESGQPCYNESKEIIAALVPNGPEETTYWAIKAMKCSDVSAVVGLPRLAKIMTDHPSPKVRAAAIRGMPRYGYEKVHQISYLIVKRIAEKESPEVVEAAASVLSKLGEDERKWARNRLKALLDSPRASAAAAKVLVEDLKQEDLVTEYVSEHLKGSEQDRNRAISMICVLPKASRSVAEPHIDQVVASIKTGAKDDPAMVALDCMGRPGFQAIRQEVVQPQRLDRPVAARALAEMNVKSTPEEALETAQRCVRDENEQVRKWCSQSLGKIGAPALPKILDLLKSNESEMKEAGKNALNFFDDPNAQRELEKVRAENSGWMANKRKLQVAEAVNTALIKIMAEGHHDAVDAQTAAAPAPAAETQKQ
jgi:HEAT repeat protein